MDAQRPSEVLFPLNITDDGFYTEIRFCKKGVGQVLRKIEELPEALKKGNQQANKDTFKATNGMAAGANGTGGEKNADEGSVESIYGSIGNTIGSMVDKIGDAVGYIGEKAKSFKDYIAKNTTPEIDSAVLDEVKDTGNDTRIAVDNVYLSKQKVYLPLPSKFPEEQFTIDWEEEKLGIFGQMYNNTAYRGSTELLQTVAAQVLDATKNKLADIEVFNKQIEGLIKGISHNSGFAFGSDDAILILKSIQRRTISLSWKLVARNEAEDQQIRDVIHLFNYNALPDNISTFGLAYPASVIIKFITRGKNHMKLQPCRITGIRKDFPETSEGLWRHDGAPVTYDFTVDLKEEFIFYLNHYIKYYMKDKLLI